MCYDIDYSKKMICERFRPFLYIDASGITFASDSCSFNGRLMSDDTTYCLINEYGSSFCK